MTEATVLHDLFSVVVRLDPAPVVVRVPTVLPEGTDPDSVARRQRAELDVTAWLDHRGTPVIPPSPLVPREPLRRDGFSMTFWQYVDLERESEPDYVANSALVPDLHAALRDYPGRLSFLSAAEPQVVADSLSRLGRPDLLEPADRDRALEEWQVLEPLVTSRTAFERAFPGVDLQPVHGDSPLANIVYGTERTLFSDFELVTLGPVEWDMAALGPDLEAAYDRSARRHGIRPLDADVLRYVDAVGMLRAVATLALYHGYRSWPSTSLRPSTTGGRCRSPGVCRAASKSGIHDRRRGHLHRLPDAHSGRLGWSSGRRYSPATEHTDGQHPRT